MDDTHLLRYSRHILLNEWGIEAQNKINASHALIIGIGGLGCSAALYLAASGIGTLTLVDYDNVDLTNLQRQILHTTARIGTPKTESARKTLSALNPEIKIQIFNQQADETLLLSLLPQADIVLDCSDNFTTRYALNRVCKQLHKPLVSGATIRWEGQFAVFDLRNPENACYQCLFPAEQNLEELRCATTGVFAPIPGIIGTMQAGEALKLLAELPLAQQLCLYNGRENIWRQIHFTRDPSCPVCNPFNNTPSKT